MVETVFIPVKIAAAGRNADKARGALRTNMQTGQRELDGLLSAGYTTVYSGPLSANGVEGVLFVLYKPEYRPMRSDVQHALHVGLMMEDHLFLGWDVLSPEQREWELSDVAERLAHRLAEMRSNEPVDKTPETPAKKVVDLVEYYLGLAYNDSEFGQVFKKAVYTSDNRTIAHYARDANRYTTVYQTIDLEDRVKLLDEHGVTDSGDVAYLLDPDLAYADVARWIAENDEPATE